MQTLSRAARRLRGSDHAETLSQPEDPSIRGQLDTPAAGDVLWRAVPVVFRGWALDGLEPAVSVEIVLNGEDRVPAQLGRPRPDVPVGLADPSASPGAGWTARVDLSAVPGTSVAVSVVATGRSGGRRTLYQGAFAVSQESFAGEIESLSLIGDALTVRGWAVIDGGLPAAVDVEVDGAPAGRARLRVPPDDVEQHPSGRLFGCFEHVVVLDPGRDPAAKVAVSAVAHGGRRSQARLAERTVEASDSRAVDPPDAVALRARTKAAIDEQSPPARGNPEPGRFRVLVFTPQLDLSGAQLYLYELLRQLGAALDSCTLVASTGGELRAEMEALGVDVVVTGQSPPTDVLTYEGRVRELSALIQGSGCQLVLANTLAEVEAVDAATRAGVPTVWAIHESFDVDHWMAMRFGGRAHPYLTQRLKTALSAAARLVFVADPTSELFARYAPAERRSTIPYGIDVDAIVDYAASADRVDLRRTHAIPPDATVLLCVGTVEERKSQACLAEAFGELARTYPNAVLAMVGDRGGAYSAALHRQIDAMRQGGRIRLVSVTKDVWEWYALADVLVSAADVESLPRTILEAMAFGLPVLAAGVFGIPEAIREGENGWLFEPRHMGVLVEAMRRVLDLPAETRRSLGAQARAEAERHFRAADYGRSYARLFAALTSAAS